MSNEMRKSDIINFLGHAYAMRTYLEICAPSTGHEFSRIDETIFKTRDRLVYMCDPHFMDSDPITFRTSAATSREITETIVKVSKEMPVYDIVFVDPWHTLKSSLVDLDGAWKLVKPGGFIVVHDCNPPDSDAARPDFRTGVWCGETYRAFIDFLCFRIGATFCTVDTDFGCGIIRKDPPGFRPPSMNTDSLLSWMRWCALPDENSAHYDYFVQTKHELLNLVSCETFLSKHESILSPASDSSASDDHPAVDENAESIRNWMHNRPWIDDEKICIDKYVGSLLIRTEFDLTAYLKQWRELGFVIFEQAVCEKDVNALLEDIEAFKENFEQYNIPVELQGRQIESANLPVFPGSDTGVKINHLHCFSKAAARLSLTKSVMEFLAHIFNEPAAVLQSLTFWRGSEQPIHVDYPYVRHQSKLPFLAASWIPLEDIDEKSGPLAYYPGGHKVSISGFFDWGQQHITHDNSSKRTPMDFANYLRKALNRHGIEKKIFCPRRGDVFIWHANLPHEGTKVQDRNLTRRSYVTHYTSLSNLPSFLSVGNDTEGTFRTMLNGGFSFVEPTFCDRKRLPSWNLEHLKSD